MLEAETIYLVPELFPAPFRQDQRAQTVAPLAYLALGNALSEAI